MNILYISALEGGKYTGPVYSVPHQVNSQEKYDNVYWINLTKIQNNNIFDTNLYHYISWKEFKFSMLPLPFNRPDLIIFEEFFKIECCLVGRQAERLKIPYIIIPRCQMTENYIRNKYWKKIIASKLLFRHFAEKAIAIQFLTEQEKSDSLSYYSGKSFIAPNGILLKKEIANVSRKPIVGTFIGRYSVWQKGIDLLLYAIEKNKTLLMEKEITFQLYGPNDRTSSPDMVKQIIDEKGLNNIVYLNGPVFDSAKEDVLLNSCFFIHTSRFEGMPMSVLEALSYGIPCLVTKGSNMRESIIEFDAGWGADNNVEGIELALQDLCNSIDKLEEKGRNAKRLAQNYSWDSISNLCHGYYADLINNK